MPFREITGHGRTLALLSGSVALASLPPSLIFSGLAGIGKRRTALALAQTLNCPTPRHDVPVDEEAWRLPVDACGECPSCRRIERLVHPDVIVIRPDEEKGNIRVEDVRALTERLGYRPYEARWRAVVIDDAETMEPFAQNALLKTLEEPPSSSVFVLVTARPDGLLDTVRSRCPQIRPDEEKGNIRVEDVCALTERLGYRPFEARWRVVVIDDAETMEPFAQNALLKTLEEPPSSSVFVLVTARPDGLLDTVRSRCPQIRFAPLTVDHVAAVLRRERALPAAEAQALAAVSGGSVGAALDSATASLAEARAAAERLLARLAPAPDVRGRLQAAGEIAGKGARDSGAGARDSLTIHLRAIQGMLRDIGVLTASGSGRAIVNRDLEASLARLAPAFHPDRLLRAFAAVDQGLVALEGNANPKIVADWVVLRI